MEGDCLARATIKTSSRFFNWTSFIVILILFLASIWMQKNLGSNKDNACLIQTAKALLQGQHYFKDFFESNTPMAVYVYMPALLIAQVGFISLAIALEIYALVMTALVLWLIQRLLIHRAFSVIARATVLCAIAAGLLIVSSADFGQREHLLIIFVLPYLIASAFVLNQTTQKYPARLSILIGVLAGVGFAIKPHFLIAFLAIEIYVGIYRKKLFCFCRPEVLAILFVQVIYLYSLFLVTPEYLADIVPINMSLYYATVIKPGNTIITPAFLICLLVLCAHCFVSRVTADITAIRKMLAVSLIAFLLIYILQQTYWYYHSLPAFILAFILLVLLMCEQAMVARTTTRKMRLLSWIAFSLLGWLITLYVCVAFVELQADWIHQKAIEPAYQRMIQFAEHHVPPHRSVFFFAPSLYPAYPMNIDTSIDTHYFNGYLITPMAEQAFAENHVGPAFLDYYVQQTIRLLQKEQPFLIFIRATPVEAYGEKKPAPYVSIFNRHKAFRQLWSHYRLIGQQDGFDVYVDNHTN